MSNETEVETKAPRKKSPATILKQEFAKITREIDLLDRKITAFEEMKAEMDVVNETRESLKSELAEVKAKLIKELGLD